MTANDRYYHNESGEYWYRKYTNCKKENEQLKQENKELKSTIKEHRKYIEEIHEEKEQLKQELNECEKIRHHIFKKINELQSDNK